MEARAKRGVSRIDCIVLSWIQLGCAPQLLSEEEKAVLAAEKAKGKDGDCSIM